MTVYQPRNRRPDRESRPNDRGSGTFNEKEAEALGLILDHMGYDVLTRSEANPEKSIEEIVMEARKSTLDWLTSHVTPE